MTPTPAPRGERRRDAPPTAAQKAWETEKAAHAARVASRAWDDGEDDEFLSGASLPHRRAEALRKARGRAQEARGDTSAPPDPLAYLHHARRGAGGDLATRDSLFHCLRHYAYALHSYGGPLDVERVTAAAQVIWDALTAAHGVQRDDAAYWVTTTAASVTTWVNAKFETPTESAGSRFTADEREALAEAGRAGGLADTRSQRAQRLTNAVAANERRAEEAREHRAALAATAAQMRAGGATLPQVADALGVSLATVKRAVAMNGSGPEPYSKRNRCEPHELPPSAAPPPPTSPSSAPLSTPVPPLTSQMPPESPAEPPTLAPMSLTVL